MPKLIGSTKGIIDWDPIVEICKNSKNGDLNTPAGVIERSEAEAEGPLLESYRSIMRTWIDAGYKLDEIIWNDYYPGEHFDIEIQDKFGEIVNAQARRVFVSEVLPGRTVPYHWDVEDKEDEWLAEGELKRWVCFMDKPKWGHVLMFDKIAFYNQPQHEIWEWDHYRDYHAGTNCGTEPYYLFHFLGKPHG